MLLTAVPLLVLDLQGLPSSVGVARDQVTTALSNQIDEHVLDRTVLLVSELVTNAVVHARTAVLIRAWVSTNNWAPGHNDGLIRVQVHDEAYPCRQLERCATLGVGRGCGLRLVDTLSTRWGVHPDRPGKYVWFEVAFPTAADAP